MQPIQNIFLKQKVVFNIKIKDSLKLINMPLRNFGNSFKLSVEKEIMPYSIYTEENIVKMLTTEYVA